MGKDKLKRFAELENMPCVFQIPYANAKEDFELKGKWREQFFKNNHPIVIELGCGRGEYTVQLAKRYSNKNFIGADIKGARIWRGGKTVTEEKMLNAAFLRIQLSQVENFFAANEVDEIWITFPDPHLKVRTEHRRLTHPDFLNRYKQILKPDGIIHLKTDSLELHEYTLEVICENNFQIIHQTKNLYSDNLPVIDLDIKTTYENIFLKAGKPITYLAFRF